MRIFFVMAVSMICSMSSTYLKSMELTIKKRGGHVIGNTYVSPIMSDLLNKDSKDLIVEADAYKYLTPRGRKKVAEQIRSEAFGKDVSDDIAVEQNIVRKRRATFPSDCFTKNNEQEEFLKNLTSTNLLTQAEKEKIIKQFFAFIANHQRKIAAVQSYERKQLEIQEAQVLLYHSLVHDLQEENKLLKYVIEEVERIVAKHVALLHTQDLSFHLDMTANEQNDADEQNSAMEEQEVYCSCVIL